MEFIADREALRQHYRAPGDGAVKKELRRLDHHAKNFLARSPFVLVGSSDDKGNADVTPKGDKPGFVAVLDDSTIAIPDRPGNNRLDTLENVLVNPAVGLLFLIPGMNETLRINGEARLTADPALREQLAAEGKSPVTVMVVAIKAVYMHCAKAFMRSDLWAPATWPERASLPTLGQVLRDHLALAENADVLDRSLDEAYRKSMW
jgi:PPOX class probable FMN-dependent enzyme